MASLSTKMIGVTVTSLQEQCFEYKWIIKNFKDIYDVKLVKGDCIVSGWIPKEGDRVGLPNKIMIMAKTPSVGVPTTSHTDGSTSSTNPIKYLYVCLGKLESSRSLDDAKCTVSIQDKNNKLLFTTEIEMSSPYASSTVGYHMWIPINNLWNQQTNLLPEGNLNIVLQMKKQILRSTSRSILNGSKSLKEKRKQRMEELLKNNSHSDVILEVGSGNDVQKFPAHKCILAISSPVFAAMFNNDMQESLEHIVRIPDIKSEVFKEALYFIYTNSFPPGITQHTDSLLHVADKYQLTKLRHLCMELMARNIDCNNVCDLLLLAELYDTKKLREECINYLIKFSKESIESEGWQRLKVAQPQLVDKLFVEICQHQDQQHVGVGGSIGTGGICSSTTYETSNEITDDSDDATSDDDISIDE